MSETHNGWTNYETWAANLWISNDEGTSEYWREAAIDARAEALATRHEVYTPSEHERWSLEDRLKSEFEESIPESVEGFWLDMVRAALSEVDWGEIAKHMLDSLDE